MDAFFSSFMNILYFAIVLGLAVIFHEWGHFIVAKMSGAKVDRFAVGFGKKLFGFTWHETEYAICALPLGGYVKIRGMDPEEELTGADYEFLQLPAWKRILIVFAGPMMNFVLALLIYIILLGTFGEPYTATTTIGHVETGTWGWEMGLRENDRILRVNDIQVNTWNEVNAQLATSQLIHPETMILKREEISLLIERDGEKLLKEKSIPKNLFTTPENVDYPDQYSGILVTNVLKDSAAEDAGLKPGMVIRSVDGKTFEYRGDWAAYLSKRYKKVGEGKFEPVPVAIRYASEDSIETVTVTPNITIPSKDAIPYQPKAKLGISFNGETSVKEYLITYSGEQSPLLGIAPKLQPVIGTVLDDGPAQKAGLREGAQITEINGEPVNDWLEVIMGIQESLYVNDQGDYSANPISLTWLTPEQEMKQETITPEVKQRNILTPTSMETGKKYAMAQLGINRQSDRKKMGLVGSIVGGWNTFIYKCQFMVDFIGRLFTGQVSRKLLGGPIAIFQLSGETGRWGMERFLDFIALLSANLGLLNLFPLPPLDGAHIIFYSYEIVRRKKMTMKQMENFGKIGFLLIIPLFLWIIFNDLDRLNFFSWIVNLFQ